jgi:hypothetical protein
LLILYGNSKKLFFKIKIDKNGKTRSNRIKICHVLQPDGFQYVNTATAVYGTTGSGVSGPRHFALLTFRHQETNVDPFW